ncbi:enoyl-(Acyl carrier) reductase family protein [Mycobacterium xenopi 3993]|nr:enoyl-(Acyl carrier) reductase family protein [Mycobacterium xenopi 3993]
MLDDASSHASLDAAPPEYVAPLYAYLVSDLADNITGETIGDEAAVVTVASTAGLRGHGVGPSYTSSKKGVIALTRLAAFQYGAKGIRINCVCPGATAGEGMGAAFTDAAMAAAPPPTSPSSATRPATSPDRSSPSMAAPSSAESNCGCQECILTGGSRYRPISLSPWPLSSPRSSTANCRAGSCTRRTRLSRSYPSSR